ncbi:MAG: AAA family ATPase [Armatimonadetes bacterium]|nr:AAA family ATPase [Armatimonadota bacterium]
MALTKRKQSQSVTVDLPKELRLAHPTIVVGGFKGGTIKTSTAVAIAERFAWVGVKILLITTDDQLDARRRLGVPPSSAVSATVRRGRGTITVRGMTPDSLVSKLYGEGFGEDYAIVIIDTPATVKGGTFPHSFLIAPVSNRDSINNLPRLLKRSRRSVNPVVFRFVEKRRRMSADDWADEVGVMHEAAGRDFTYIENPVHRSDPISDAHDAQGSVWDIPRRDNALEYLDTINELAEMFWETISSQALPPMPRRQSSSVFVEGLSGLERF